MNILLMEDNISLNNAITKMLEIEGYKVDKHFDGQSVLNTIEKNITHGLYILDVNVPHYNGIEVLKYLKAKNPNLKVIISSADKPNEKLGYKYGCDEFIQKPFTFDKLKEVVDKHLP